MGAKGQSRWRQGFTMVEMLAAAAIVAILLGVSAVGVVYFARWLKITELDNAAREIYLAAENRAVLLSGSGRLETLVKDDDKSVTVKLSTGSDDPETAPGYYIYHKGGEEAADLLPDGTIDPALMEGSFYIVYEPEGGSVTDVFYVENETYDVETFQRFYDEVSVSAKSVRMQMKPMVGYYGGGTAENAKDNALGTPIVIIKNEETLTVEITYAVLPSMVDKAELTVILDYGGCVIDITPDKVLGEEKDGRVRFSYTILLDSLDGLHFYDLFEDADAVVKPTTFGKDFTVTATLTAEGATPSSGNDTDNSLFAEGSGDETAYIANLRHLQNLDINTSKVDGKTEAVQTADIDCATYLGEDYSFVPIENVGLKSYTVQKSEAAEGEDAAENYIIQNLNVTESSRGEEGAGLFAEADNKTITGVRLVNAKVDGGNLPAGALAGHAKNAVFDDCRVYWEQESGSLRDVLGDNKNGYNYQITGSIAGGLVGQMDGGTITNCLAATLVEGDTVGGLVGKSTDTVKITGSYADCYLSGKTVGGLAGTAGTLNLENCYAAGFIEIEDKAGVSAAGLCTSEGVTGDAVYSVMYCSDAEEIDWEPLAPNMTETKCYYLSSAVSSEPDSSAMTYKEMVSEDFAKTLGTAFGNKDQDSHPYNLRMELALTVYNFPGLSHLPHYGDWNTQFVEPSLVYYEQYLETVYGFYGGGVDALQQDVKPIKDGYAIAIRSEGVQGESLKVTIDNKEYEYKTNDLHTVTGADGNKYLLALLPDEMVNVKSAKEEFYLPFTFKIGSETYRYYYCPHFAKTAIKTQEMPPAPAGISVRTPRHLYMLSLYPEYYNKNRIFYQELDLDYSYYKGYDLFPANFTQVPIGRVDKAFNGIYDGGCHTIENLVFQTLEGTTRAYAGLFGYSSGTLRNIVYLMDAERQNAVSLGSHGSLYIGGLAGGNAGTVVNCAAAGVNLKGMAYTAYIYIGGLVGLNQGTIDSCGAECASLTAETSSYAYAYIGGLVGQNRGGGMITTSYAVGRASANADSISKARVCGFVGYNQGQIKDSYAAMDLMSSGKAVETYGFCGVTYGSQSGTCFLNIGNFTYRGTPYNASYTPRKAAGVEYDVLTDPQEKTVAGMGYVPADDTADSFPYPTAVKNAAGNPVHYGEWPKRMQLGIMGVYYWEELSFNIENVKPTYHISLMAVNTEDDPKTITKLSTLSTAHSDNGVVTDYGYGYYYTDLGNDGISVDLTATNIYYSEKGGAGTPFPAQIAEDDDGINDKLAELMPGYTFHSYHSFGMEEDGGGLYPTGSPNGTFTLTRREGNNTNTTVKFTVNPHFADALAVESAEDWKLVNASTNAPGSTAGNPYEVRAVSQLFAINWNSTNLNTQTVMDTNGNYQYFPYLSYQKNFRDYFWKQTHDIHGESATYTPIAEYYDTKRDNTGELKGWFGGTFDGDDYVIENVNIKGQTSSVAGLFGVVFNGSLKNIVLYSSDGQGTITNEIDTTLMDSAWYSMGTLAGMVSARENTPGYKGSAVENCSASGYTIKYKTYNRLDNGNKTNVAGGSTVGGLLGASDMELKNCSAVTTIKILKGDAEKTYGNDNLRAGGLTGVCQNKITNCYAGGSITVESGVIVKVQNGLYFGGIVGGGYFKPLTVKAAWDIGIGGGGSNVSGTMELTNCYSYVELPDQDAEVYITQDKPVQSKNPATEAARTYIKALYAIGGQGDGTSVYTAANCYYLESEVLKNNQQGVSTLKTDILSVVRTVDTVVDGKTVTVPLPDRIDQTGSGGIYTVDLSNYSKVNTRGGVQWCARSQDLNGTSIRVGAAVFKVTNAAAGQVQFLGWVLKNEGSGAGQYALTNDPKNIPQEPMPLTYAQLSGTEPIIKNGESKYIMGTNGWLTAFTPVTSRTDDGFFIPGKFSYPSEAHLRGLNYPFPTILMRENVYHVHYGNWPINGIKRTTGGEPIELDLLSKPEHTEKIGTELTLEGMGGGTGVWGATTAHTNIAEAKFENGALIVTGKNVGVTTLTLTYTENGVTSTMILSVNVTAQLELRATGSKEGATVRLFTNDTVDVELSAYGSDAEDPLNLEELGVTVAAEVGTFDNAMLDTAAVDGKLILHLATGGTGGSTTVSLNYTYKHEGVEYTGISAVTFQVTKPEVKTAEDGTTSLIFEGGAITDAKVTAGDFDGGTLTFDPDGNTVSLDMNGVPAGEITVEVTLTMGGWEHRVTVTVPWEGAPSEESQPPEPDESGGEGETESPTPTPDTSDPSPEEVEPGDGQSTAANSQEPAVETAALPEQPQGQDESGDEEQTE